MNAFARHWAIAKAALADDRERVKAKVEATQPSFLPAALEIIETPISPTARMTAWLMLGGLSLSLLWAFFGKVDVVASASGKLIPADNVKLVQPAEAGIVRAILVRDGQQVKKGQVLIEFDPTVSGAENAQAASALQTAKLDAARAQAILSALNGKGLAFHPPQGTPADVTQTQRQLARSELEALLAGTSGKLADVQAARAARDEALTQAAKLTETLPLIDQQLEAQEALLANGYASKLKVIELRRQRLATARDRDAALQTATRMGAMLSGAGNTSAQAKAEARVKVLGDLAKAQAEISLREEELIKSHQRDSLQRLAAPVNGTVAQLTVHTIGGVVEATKPIMVIVPNGGSLVAEVKLLNKDAGFVRAGQPVEVKLEAFPFTRYGTVSGRVESVGSDAVPDDRLGLVYTARITLDRATIAGNGISAPLTPGLAATADIRTGRRSIISYLVSPIDETAQEAGRER
ncbi:HlyD family type I secretion periplasmic adaptor subunit [Sphingobium sp. B11D3A]|uniref:HlyD family type I secretion periplasmic adaptor subunit n=1 Tax=Sphingobium sp. B11D3A TaxID=2940574 RepID=UPI0022258801|nr:HlyD family type I secretion periplasmic adaptor subunit [Sphingobium sp. B11D3A]MCW2393508.1 hemolysin D [Sphingobium sp. B11D3A]